MSNAERREHELWIDEVLSTIADMQSRPEMYLDEEFAYIATERDNLVAQQRGL